MVRCHLEYCSPLWKPTKISDIQELESVQRAFSARIDTVQQSTPTLLGTIDKIGAHVFAASERTFHCSPHVEDMQWNSTK